MSVSYLNSNPYLDKGAFQKKSPKKSNQVHLIKGKVTIGETLKPVKVTMILEFVLGIESNQGTLNFCLAYGMGKY